MRKLLILVLGLLVVSCQSNNDLTLEASLKNVEDGTPVYFSKLAKGTRVSPIDTVEVKNGKITIDLPKVDFQTLNVLKIKGVNGNLLFINENEPLTATIYKDSIRMSTVKGGPANKLFTEYMHLMVKTNHKMMAMVDNYSKEQLQDPAVREKLMAKQKEMAKEIANYSKSAIEKNPNALPSLFIFSDLMRTHAVPMPEMQKLYEGLSDQLKNTFIGKQIEKSLEQASAVAIGSKAPSFSAKTPEGKELSLKEAMGEYTLIDFWASWCKPCRVENPNIVKAYKKYHDQGLNIIGVSLDKSKEKWMAAIKEDGLVWSQVSNLKFWQDPIARKYNVRAIPANFLIDKNGKIIAKNLRGAELAQKMEELLSAKK